MESVNITISKKLAKEKDYQYLVLHMLIYRRLIQHDERITKKYIECYNLQKDDRETMSKYVQNVDQCISSHKKQFDLTRTVFEDTLDSLKQAEDIHRSRSINCFNLVSENELNNCKEVEKRNLILKIKSIYESIPELSTLIKK